jgi:hypothetical protein
VAARSLATPRSPILMQFLLDKNTFADFKSLWGRKTSGQSHRGAPAAAAAAAADAADVPVENIVVVQSLDPKAKLDEEHPRLILRHHLPLLRQPSQTLKHVTLGCVLSDDVQVHLVHEGLVELDDIRALYRRQDTYLARRLAGGLCQVPPPNTGGAHVGREAAPTSFTASSRSFWVIFCVLICFIA